MPHVPHYPYTQKSQVLYVREPFLDGSHLDFFSEKSRIRFPSSRMEWIVRRVLVQGLVEGLYAREANKKTLTHDILFLLLLMHPKFNNQNKTLANTQITLLFSLLKKKKKKKLTNNSISKIITTSYKLPIHIYTPNIDSGFLY